MLPRIKRILHPTDLSTNARHALGYSFSLATALGGTVTILHVLEELSPSTLAVVKKIVGDDRWQGLKKEKEEQVIDVVRAKIVALCEELSSNIPECPLVVDNILVESGQPVEHIIRKADQAEYDLVVMGSRGQGILSEAMLGSVSRGVVRQCPKPVLTVKIPPKI